MSGGRVLGLDNIDTCLKDLGRSLQVQNSLAVVNLLWYVPLTCYYTNKLL